MSSQNTQQKVDQTAQDVQKQAGKAADDVSKEANSLLEQGTKLASDTLAYAQQQAQGILGGAKNSDASKQADQAANDVSKKADQAAKEGQATLSDLTEQARHLVGDILTTTNEYIKPQEAGDQAQGYIAQARTLASNVIDKSAEIISGAQKEASKVADDPDHAKTLASQASQSAHDGASKAINTVADATK